MYDDVYMSMNNINGVEAMLIVFIVCAVFGVLTIAIHVVLELNKLSAIVDRETDTIRKHYES